MVVATGINTSITAEHLFINRSYKFTVNYGGGKFTLDCPMRIKKYVSYIGNYLCIKELANREIGNAPIWEKIQYYDSYITKNKTLGCEFADAQFKLIKESFNGFPDMSIIFTQEEAEIEFNRYYSSFEERYKLYMDKLKKNMQGI